MDNTPKSPEENQPDWMDDIQDHADRVLGELDSGTAYDQVHPVIASWYDDELEKEPPESRPAVWQAVACLATEIMMDAENDDSLAPLLESADDEAVAMWIEHILLVGRAMEISLRNGDLDDL